jgi:hypothetical protein
VVIEKSAADLITPEKVTSEVEDLGFGCELNEISE